MKEITILELFSFLEYLAKTEIGPASDLTYDKVTFTISEVRAAFKELCNCSELYLRFRQENEAQKAY